MLVIDAQNSDWPQVLTAISTVVAVLSAVVGAWISWLSARAAREAVKEARLGRSLELAPKLILEKEFFDFQFFWPHPDSLNGEPVFLARKRWKDTAPTLPTFSLQNFGQSPALEVTIVWELEDPNGEFDLSERIGTLGFSVMDGGACAGEGVPIKSLMCSKPDGSGTGLPLCHKWTTDIPSCSPNQKRTVEFPVHLLNTFFLRGLQLGATMSKDAMVLTAHISGYALDRVQYQSQFRWKVIPFYHGQTNPVVVHGHFFELPIYPKPSGPRVA
ncbi:hypothetical protein HDE76_004018 [Rhodanobacter sp. ANJX3]|nr:hypothetical protein [Rhodanobacter sp. ANJX3]